MKYYVKKPEERNRLCFGCDFFKSKCIFPTARKMKEIEEGKVGCSSGKYIFKLASKRQIQRYRMRKAKESFLNSGGREIK